MAFHKIDLETWPRREYYEHYIHQVVCTYSITVRLDITRLGGHKIYPSMLWLLTQTVNEFAQFRTQLTPEGLGYFDEMHPRYTVFSPEKETFSSIWTLCGADFPAFLARYREDVARYAPSGRFSPKPGQPENCFDVSMLPWMRFEGLNLNIFGEGKYLLPIFTMGQAFVEGEKTLLPLAIQAHHAVCDGYHVSQFVAALQEKIAAFAF